MGLEISWWRHMNKPFDFLVSDKQPFLYVEKSIVCMKDGFLTALSGKEGKKLISPSSHLIMMLGTGTSITQEAAIFSAQHDMHIAFVRGGSNIHTYFQEGRYQDPMRLVNQVNNQSHHKLEIARELMKLRFKLLKENRDSEIDSYPSIDELTLFEARWAKSLYRKYCLRYKIESFKRDFNGEDMVNQRLNILNNVLYSLCSSIILSCHLSPSIAFIHGFSRRGGLAFDLADLIKTPTIVRLAFSADKEKNTRQLMYHLMSMLKENNNYYFKLLIHICLMLGEDDYAKEKWDVIYANFGIK